MSSNRKQIALVLFSFALAAAACASGAPAKAGPDGSPIVVADATAELAGDVASAVGVDGGYEALPPLDVPPDLAPASLTIAPELAVDLGAVVVGQSGLHPATFTVRNTGEGPSGTVSAMVAGDGFAATSTCGTTGLAPGHSCDVIVTFTPTSPGSKAGQLVVSANPGGTRTVFLAGVGLAENGDGGPGQVDLADAGPGNLSVSPNFVAFPDTTVGSISGAQSVTVQNTGGSAVGNVTVAIGDPTNFGLTTTCSGALAAGAKCIASVVFTPKTKGAKSSALSIMGRSQSLTVALSGNGQTSPQLVIAPSSASVAGIVNRPSAPITFIVGNSGDVDTGTPTVSLSGTNIPDFKISSNTCVTPIKGLSTCTVEIVFNPAFSGTRLANLVVSAFPGGMVTVPITGTAVPATSLELSPNPLDLGTVTVGSQSAAKTLSVKSSGGSASGALTVTLASSEFAKGADTCTGVALPPNAACTIDVSITANSPGTKSAILVVSGGAAGNAVATLTATARSP